MNVLQAIVNYPDFRDFIVDEYLPSGSGFDDKPSIVEASDLRVEIYVRYHPMNSDGYYESWVSEMMIVTPSILFGFTVSMTDNSGAEELDVSYIKEMYSIALDAPFDYKKAKERVYG